MIEGIEYSYCSRRCLMKQCGCPLHLLCHRPDSNVDVRLIHKQMHPWNKRSEMSHRPSPSRNSFSNKRLEDLASSTPTSSTSGGLEPQRTSPPESTINVGAAASQPACGERACRTISDPN